MTTISYTLIGIGTVANDGNGTTLRAAASISLNPYLENISNALDIDDTTNNVTFVSDIIMGSIGGSSSGQFTASFNGSLVNAMYLRNTDTGASSDTLFNFDRNGTLTGSITHTDVATAFNTSSDPRLKSEFRKIKKENAWLKFDALYSCLGEFDWLNKSAYNVWGWDAHKALELGLNLATDGKGPRNVELGTIYDTINHPAELGDIEHQAEYKTIRYPAKIGLIAILNKDGTETGQFFEGIATPAREERVLIKEAWVEKDAVIKEAWTEELKVTPAGVDQGRPTPTIIAVIKDLRDRLEALEA